MIQPFGKRVIIKRDAAKVEVGGLHIPEEAQKKELTGVVLAIGDGVEDVSVGDRVVFGKFDGVDLDSKYAEENCILINEEQIKAIYV